MAIEILKRLIITFKHVKFETDKCHLIGSGKRHKLPMTKSGNEKKSNQKRLFSDHFISETQYS